MVGLTSSWWPLNNQRLDSWPTQRNKGIKKVAKNCEFFTYVFVSICFSQQKYPNQNLDVTNTWKGLINGDFFIRGAVMKKGPWLFVSYKGVKKLGGGFKICFRLPENLGFHDLINLTTAHIL